jgi:hypothetical protein
MQVQGEYKNWVVQIQMPAPIAQKQRSSHEKLVILVSCAFSIGAQRLLFARLKRICKKNSYHFDLATIIPKQFNLYSHLQLSNVSQMIVSLL